jgi:hypothetical protein
MTMKMEHCPELNWRMIVHGYHLPGSVGKAFDSDWLDATLYMHAGQGMVKRSLKFLLVEELERIVVWLERVRDHVPVDDLELIDPAFRFKLITRNRIPFVKVIHGSDPKRRLVVDQSTDIAALNACMEMVKKQIGLFPCRCGRRHYTNINVGATEQRGSSQNILVK